MRIKVKLTLEEIEKGCEKKIKVAKYVSCKDCGGSGARNNSYDTCSQCHGTGVVTEVRRTILGQMQTQSVCPSCGGQGQIIKDKCHSCNGEGIVRSEEIITINIPAGVADGMQLSMSGKGNAAPRGGVPGDLIVLVEEIPHDTFERQETNLYYNAFITFAQAAMGATVEIPTLTVENYQTVFAGILNKLPAESESAKSITALKTSLDSYNAFYLGLLAYTDGVASAADGANKLASGASDLKDGIAQLKDGAMQLNDGLKRFNEEGIQKIIDLVDGDLNGIVARLKATIDVSKNYRNFAGISDDMDGQVKFIYRTDEISSK